MTLLQPKKIFLETDEEISFLLDKVETSDKEKIIIVIPERSILFQTSITLRIFLKKTAEFKKIILFVVEGEREWQILQSNGFVAVNKVSQITDEIWNLAEKRNKIEKKFTQFQEEIHDKDTTIEKVEVKEEKDLERSELEQSKSFRKERIIEIDGIKIYAGGDIEKLDNLSNNNNNLEENMNLNNDKKYKTFSGKDLRGNLQLGSKLSIQSLVGKKNFQKKDKFSFFKFFRFLFFIILFLVSIVGVLYYIIIYRVATIEIGIEPALETKETQFVFTAESNRTEVSFVEAENKVKLPVFVTNDEILSGKKSAQATGKLNNGGRAKGFVTLYNQTNKVISIPAGTSIKNISGDLEYIIKADVNVPASNSQEAVGVGSAGVANDVPVEAKEPSEKYNITDANSNTIFQVGSYSLTNQLEARRFLPFEGGSTKEVIVVSEEDKNKLKELLEKDLKLGVLQNLNKNIPASSSYLEGTEKYKITRETISSKVGEQTTDGTFEITLEIAVNGLFVTKSDLENSAKVFMEKEKQEIILNLSNISISPKQIAEGIYELSVNTNTSKQKEINLDALRVELKGIDYIDLENYLKNKTEISKYKIVYDPFFIPENFRKIPSASSSLVLKLL